MIFGRRKADEFRGCYITHEENPGVTALVFFKKRENAHAFAQDLERRGVRWKVHTV